MHMTLLHHCAGDIVISLYMLHCYIIVYITLLHHCIYDIVTSLYMLHCYSLSEVVEQLLGSLGGTLDSLDTSMLRQLLGVVERTITLLGEYSKTISPTLFYWELIQAEISGWV